jgi:hypothetical protein
MKYRLIIFILIMAVLFACGCTEQQQSIHVQDKYDLPSFGGAQKYFIVDGPTTYECADEGIYNALNKDGTYTVVVNPSNNKITKVIT